jgi:CheY-like chemotaxis protein
MSSILLALPETARLRYTETVLQRAGYQVLSAATGDEAIRASNQGAESLDLLVMDFSIEESHCGLLRGMYPNLPVLVLADAGSGDILDRVRQALARSPSENA